MALNAAIGQGDVNVTPLQLALMYSAVANGGALYQPQVVRRVESPEGGLVEAFGPKLVRTVEMTEDQRHVLVDALKAVVNEPGGTAFYSRLGDVTVAGKTGTAQVARLGQVRLKAEQMGYWERDHAWFAAFAPADDPEVTVVVLNEHSGFGAASAAPTAAAILKKYFELKKTDAQAFAEPMLATTRATRPPPAPPVPVTPAPAPLEVRAPAPAPEVVATPSVPPPPDVAPSPVDPGEPHVPVPQGP
jgi:penicillin-binding protein 2